MIESRHYSSVAPTPPERSFRSGVTVEKFGEVHTEERGRSDDVRNSMGFMENMDQEDGRYEESPPPIRL